MSSTLKKECFPTCTSKPTRGRHYNHITPTPSAVKIPQVSAVKKARNIHLDGWGKKKFNAIVFKSYEEYCKWKEDVK